MKLGYLLVILRERSDRRIWLRMQTGLRFFAEFTLSRGSSFDRLRMSGYKGLRMSGYKGLRMSGYEGLRMSGYEGLIMTEKMAQADM